MKWLQEFITAVDYQWSRKRWQPRLINLDRQLEHVGAFAGLAFLIFVVKVGMASQEPQTGMIALRTIWLWVEQSITYAVAAGLVMEAVTIAIKRNWTDSTFDFVQDAFVLTFAYAVQGEWLWFGIFVTLWLALYFVLLLNDW